MDFTREGLCYKAKSIISTFYGIILWAASTTSPSPMQTTTTKAKLCTTTKFGLNIALPNSEKETPKNLIFIVPQIIHSHMITSPPPPPPFSSPSSSTSSSSSHFDSTNLSSLSSFSSWASSLTGDLIGTENGVYTCPDEDLIMSKLMEGSHPYDNVSSRVYNQKKKEKAKAKAKKKEYPPAIPLLARTGNLPGRMPWVLARHYIDDEGRLILTEQRVKNHEYFEAERENGRLMLTLVALESIRCSHEKDVDDDDDNERVKWEDNGFIEEVEKEEEKVNHDVSNKDDNERAKLEDIEFMEAEDEEKVENDVVNNAHEDGNERAKLEDIDFMEEVKENENGVVDNVHDADVYGLLQKVLEDGVERKLLTTSFACSVPKSWERCTGDDYGVRMCFSYEGTTTFAELFERRRCRRRRSEFMSSTQTDAAAAASSTLSFGSSSVSPMTTSVV